MPTNDNPKFAVVGAGLGGALMTAYLGRAGYEVDVYEKRPDPRLGKSERGRSINLAMSVRGIHALEEIGIADEVLKKAVPMKGRIIHSFGGQRTFQPYGTQSWQVINSVSRAGLNIALLNAAEQYQNVRLFFNQKCTGIDLECCSVELTSGTTTEQQVAVSDIVVGSDGAFSAIRNCMQRLERFDYRQDYLTHGYKELEIPPGPGGAFTMDKNALHIWPRGGFMMIALPNANGSYTCTLFWPFEGPNSFASLKTKTDIQEFFERNFADAVSLMPTLVEDFQKNPTSSLVTIRCSPWYFEDKVVLLGDAAHAVVPFYGQGMNASFEDCTVLNECILEHAPDWKKAFAAYHERRKVHIDTLADLALANFIEMRDQVASETFLFKKRLERTLHRLLPKWYVPLYTMVTFSRTPYAEAVERAKRQNQTLRAVGCVLLVIMLLILVVWIY